MEKQLQYLEEYKYTNGLSTVFLLKREIPGFKIRFQESEEAFRIGTVDDPMIVGQREIGHVPDSDIVIPVRGRENFRTFLYGPDA